MSGTRVRCSAYESQFSIKHKSKSNLLGKWFFVVFNRSVPRTPYNFPSIIIIVVAGAVVAAAAVIITYTNCERSNARGLPIMVQLVKTHRNKVVCMALALGCELLNVYKQ